MSKKQLTSIEEDKLNKKELSDLLNKYDKYIQNANDENSYKTGWKPVCINEFYDCEYQDILYERNPECVCGTLKNKPNEDCKQMIHPGPTLNKLESHINS